MTTLAVLLFAGPLTTLLVLAACFEAAAPLETADAGVAAAVILLAACAWVVLLRRLRPWIDRRLEALESELPRPLLVREETGAGAASSISDIRSQS